MIELYKIVTRQDSDVILKFNTIPDAFTRGNTYKIRQDHVRYDLWKFLNFSFSDRVRTLWNSLPDIVVKAECYQFQGKIGQILEWSGS